MYKDILKNDSKAIGFFADQLALASSDKEFFRMIVMDLVPLMRQSRTFAQIYARFMKAKHEYDQEYNHLEEQSLSEFKEVLRSLNSAIHHLKLQDNLYLKKAIEDVEQIFVSRASYGVPSYLNSVYQGECFLLEALLSLGCHDLVQNYAVVDNCSIRKMTFAPSFIKLQELDGAKEIQYTQLPWVAWDYIALVEWCWSVPFSFFSGIKNFESQSNSMQLVMLHDHWLDIDNIKKGRTTNSIFRRDFFLVLVKLIIRECIIEQDANGGSQGKEVETPHSITLSLRQNLMTLLLNVKWSEGGQDTAYILHKFHDDSGPYHFMKAFFEAQVGAIIKLNKIEGIGSGASVVKLLRLLNLDNVLGRTFFSKRKTVCIVKENETIYGKDFSFDDKVQVQKLISSLKLYNP